MTDRPHLALGEYLPFLVNRVGSALAVRFAEDALVRHGLTIVMWRALAVLADRGARRQIDLAEETSIEVSTLSRLVTRLVRMGLVTRRRSAASQREVTVELTRKGSVMVERLVPVAIGYEALAVAGLSARDLAVVKRALRRMHENMVRSTRRSGAADR